MKISIIAPNYQGRDVFPACIKSLLKQKFTGYEIIFADDGSTDKSYELAKELFGKEKNVRIVRSAKNIGYVRICNYALKFCKGTYIMCVNNDSTFPTNWIKEMYRTIDRKSNTVGGSFVIQGEQSKKMLDQIRKGWVTTDSLVGLGGIWRRMTKKERKEGLWITNSCGAFIVPRDALKNQLFEKSYVAYAEDIEFSWRLKIQGYKIVVNTNARLDHIGSFTRKVVPAFNRTAIIHGTKNTIRNFLVFYTRKTQCKLALPFLFMQFCLLLSRPRTLHLVLYAYWLTFVNWSDIQKHRQRVQKSRTISDASFMHLMSYRFYDAKNVGSCFKPFVHLGNALLRAYYILVCIRTYDFYDHNALPNV